MGQANLTVRHVDAEEYRDWIASPFVDDEIGPVDGTRLVVVHGGDVDDPIPGPGSLPVIVCGRGPSFGATGPAAFDLVVTDACLDDLASRVVSAPRAATALAVLLRGQGGAGVDDGLAAESAVYSLLQDGPEFRHWRSENDPRRPPTDTDVVASRRTGTTLTITLDRPHRHNAITAALRDELATALAVARSDDAIVDVELRGRGPSFCSGGDLDEFGSRPDPATAHLTRLARSPARVIDRLGNVTAFVHGSAFGGGVELAAFARRVVADPATRFALPELGLGLIPGAGGTVSLTRRVGRQRTAALGLTGRVIDAGTALDWGLVDSVEPVLPDPAPAPRT